MSVTIAPAAMEQLPALAALEEATFAFPRGREQIERALGGFLTATQDGALCGYGDYTAVLDEGYIGNLAVAPRWRRQGIGGALLDALLAHGARQALAFLTLEVRESNAAARALYASRGFLSVGIRPGHYSKPLENAVIMTYYYEKGI